MLSLNLKSMKDIPPLMTPPHPSSYATHPNYDPQGAYAQQAPMPYRFRLRKGEFELELSSDDAQFIAQQMEQWQHLMMHMSTPSNPPMH
jgi:hypothetical protein